MKPLGPTALASFSTRSGLEEDRDGWSLTRSRRRTGRSLATDARSSACFTESAAAATGSSCSSVKPESCDRVCGGAAVPRHESGQARGGGGLRREKSPESAGINRRRRWQQRGSGGDGVVGLAGRWSKDSLPILILAQISRSARNENFGSKIKYLWRALLAAPKFGLTLACIL